MTDASFALPRDGVKFEDCDFYHTVEIPGRGVVHGNGICANILMNISAATALLENASLRSGQQADFLRSRWSAAALMLWPLKFPTIPAGILFHSLMTCCSRTSLRVVST